MDIAGVVDDAEAVEQPQDDCDHDDGVDNGFDRVLHRDEVDQPENDADDDQSDDYISNRHARKITECAD